MTTTKETKKLSVTQYEFYKKGDTPMADTAIAKIYSMNINQLNAFKQENDLIGKYRKKSQAEDKKEPTLYTGKKVDVKPLREKEIGQLNTSTKNGWEQANAQLIKTDIETTGVTERDIKSLPEVSPSAHTTSHITEKQVMERHAESSQKPPSRSFEPRVEPFQPSDVVRPVSNTAVDYSAMLVESAVHSDESLKVEEEKEVISELLEHLANLNEENELLQFKLEESKDNAAGWERKFREEYECSAMWRDRHLEASRQMDQLKEEIGIEVEKHKEAQCLMDEALLAAYQDKKVAVAFAEKFVSDSKRNMEVG